MAQDYQYYNDYSQQDKDSMRTARAEESNENEATLIGQTDEVEGLLKTVNEKLDTLTKEIKTQLDDANEGIETLIQHIKIMSNTLSDLKNDTQEWHNQWLERQTPVVSGPN